MKIIRNLFFALFIIVLWSVLDAAPSVIRDSRINKLSTTPILGRGYIISTNSFRLSCLKYVKSTTPSYDFQYTFKSIAHEEAMRLVIENEYEIEASAAYGGSGASASGQKNYVETAGVKEYFHHIKVEINMDSYYASLDEAQTGISPSAKRLLTGNNLPGFFRSCGSHYIRSLGRNSRFIAVFSYRDKTTEADASFENSLKMEIKGFGDSLTYWESKKRAASGAKVSVKKGGGFSQSARTKKLTITVLGWGLGKRKNTVLIAYSLASFKSAVKDVFVSMQKPGVGKVTSMEIVPWVENTEFQETIKIDQKTGENLPLSKKKNILTDNAEFLAEINSIDRGLMNKYYKARLCRQMIDEKYKFNNEFLPLAKDTLIVNRRTREQKKLGELDSKLTNEYIESLYSQENEFMHGEGGVQSCINGIMEGGFFSKNWRDIEVCKKLKSKAKFKVDPIVSGYCLPRLAPPKSTPLKKK
ncbi:MAG: hypothetical protein GY754_27170 [bacterium]|nr:hypothetical protein [bacterium]